MRISFVGGATDIENYYSQFGGEVVSCAINRYIYITLNKRDDNKIVVCYTETESVCDVNQVKHPIVKEALKMTGITKSIEIHIISNISTIGTGLGGSSAVAVGLLKALFPEKTNREIAEMACDLEINKMGKCIGKQDQYACAFGGLNYFKFDKKGVVTSEKYVSSHAANTFLKDKMFLVKVKNNHCRVDTGLLLDAQSKYDNTEYLNAIKSLCLPFVKALNDKDDKAIINLINQYWKLKKQLSEYVTNEDIDQTIDYYVKKGCGAKLCGAGQNGFISVYDPSKQCKGIPVKVTPGTTISSL
jgi:D-glycero-alpha-D-manno-heptose-7-phosphate kinase